MREQRSFIAGFEESYGYLAGDFVRDKDAVISCALDCRSCSMGKGPQGMTIFELLLELYREFGFYKESLISL
jgi:phosphoglucomutase